MRPAHQGLLVQRREACSVVGGLHLYAAAGLQLCSCALPVLAWYAGLRGDFACVFVGTYRGGGVACTSALLSSSALLGLLSTASLSSLGVLCCY